MLHESAREEKQETRMYFTNSLGKENGFYESWSGTGKNATNTTLGKTQIFFDSQ